ncbi:TRAP-type transport system [Vibrio ishigakensis]|uniref:TRAP-type transport system n=1 Tax=Vibrio ishigakensis TaxID=1481914 RepID=A0A0B8QGD7_9VIBR|nr:TRAP-type transport system [Vibrio ishigakensis]
MAIVCLIAGMGLPTSAAYVLVSAVFAPALIQQGFEALTVHLFVLYYAALSVITPPVCISVFVAAAISKDPWHKVAGYTLRLGGTAYLLPLLFLFNLNCCLRLGYQHRLYAGHHHTSGNRLLISTGGIPYHPKQI